MYGFEKTDFEHHGKQSHKVIKGQEKYLIIEASAGDERTVSIERLKPIVFTYTIHNDNENTKQNQTNNILSPTPQIQQGKPSSHAQVNAFVLQEITTTSTIHKKAYICIHLSRLTFIHLSRLTFFQIDLYCNSTNLGGNILWGLNNWWK